MYITALSYSLLIALNPRTLLRDLSTSGIKERKTRFERNSIVEDKDAGNGSGKGSGRETWESSCGRACNHELVSWETSRSSRFVSFRFVKPNRRQKPISSLFQRKWKPCETESFAGGQRTESGYPWFLFFFFFDEFLQQIRCNRKDYSFKAYRNLDHIY